MISRGTPMLPVVLAACLFGPGCVTTGTYGCYEGPFRSLDEVSIILCNTSMPVSLQAMDGKELETDSPWFFCQEWSDIGRLFLPLRFEFHLPPGSHTLVFGFHASGPQSMPRNWPYFYTTRPAIVSLNLERGHVYELGVLPPETDGKEGQEVAASPIRLWEQGPYAIWHKGSAKDLASSLVRDGGRQSHWINFQAGLGPPPARMFRN